MQDVEMTTRNKAILIARALKTLGFPLLSQYAEKEKSEEMLNGYLRIVELKCENNKKALEEIYYFGILPIVKENRKGVA